MVYHVLALEVLDDQLHDVLQQDAEMVGQMRIGGVSPVLGADVPGVSRRRCGRGEPSPGPDVAAVSPVPAQTWKG